MTNRFLGTILPGEPRAGAFMMKIKSILAVCLLAAEVMGAEIPPNVIFPQPAIILDGTFVPPKLCQLPFGQIKVCGFEVSRLLRTCLPRILNRAKMVPDGT